MNKPLAYPVIQESGWRWRLSQLFFKLFYKRDYMWFTPWKNGGFAANVVVFYEDKVLLAKRRGVHLVEQGKWCCPGGYLDLKARETFAQGALRETWEEMNIKLDPSKLTEDKRCHFSLHYGTDMPEMKDYAHVVVCYWYVLSDSEYAMRGESDEAHELTLFDEGEFEQMVQAEKIAGMSLVHGIRAAFAAYKENR